MSIPTERVPIPWPQRRELLRERLFPILCFAATVAACAWLWQRQAAVAPVAIGEVYGASVEIKSPYDGEVIALGQGGGEEDGGNRQLWPLFAKLSQGDVAVRVRRSAEGAAGETIAVEAPLTGSVTARSALVGQHVRRGDVLLRISSASPEFIVCHLPYQWQTPPRAGAEVAVRIKGRSSATWVRSTVEATGPAVEPAPAYPGLDSVVASRGVPLRIALPKGFDALPGSLVEVRLLALTSPH